MPTSLSSIYFGVTLYHCYPGKHATLTQSRLHVGPPSAGLLCWLCYQFIDSAALFPVVYGSCVCHMFCALSLPCMVITRGVTFHTILRLYLSGIQCPPHLYGHTKTFTGDILNLFSILLSIYSMTFIFKFLAENNLEGYVEIKRSSCLANLVHLLF